MSGITANSHSKYGLAKCISSSLVVYSLPVLASANHNPGLLLELLLGLVLLGLDGIQHSLLLLGGNTLAGTTLAVSVGLLGLILWIIPLLIRIILPVLLILLILLILLVPVLVLLLILVLVFILIKICRRQRRNEEVWNISLYQK